MVTTVLVVGGKLVQVWYYGMKIRVKNNLQCVLANNHFFYFKL